MYGLRASLPIDNQMFGLNWVQIEAIRLSASEVSNLKWRVCHCLTWPGLLPTVVLKIVTVISGGSHMRH